MGLFDFLMNRNDDEDDNYDDEEILFLPDHMEVFDFEIDNILYTEADAIEKQKNNDEFDDCYECEMIFSRN